MIATLAKSYCDTVTEPQFTEIGIYREGKHLWIAVAAPLTLPSSRDAAAIGKQAVELVNAARSKARRCGGQSFPAVKPLQLSAKLTRAASMHAQDMAAHNFFEHEGSDGSMPSQRVARAGYAWRAVAENIAAGAISAEEAVNGWLKSPGHCVNIMSGAYTQMGIAYATDPKSDADIYWSQVFAAPR